MSKISVAILFVALLVSGLSQADAKTKRAPASSTCSGAAKQYAEFAAATNGSPVCAKRASYVAKGYTPLQVADNCAADFASQTTTSGPENGVFTVSVAGSIFMVACTYDASDNEDKGCHCSTAAAN